VAIRKDGRKDSFIERFQFTKNEKRRLHGLKRITETNEKLQKLLSQSTKASSGSKRIVKSSRSHHRKGWKMMSSLYNAMTSCWTCNCDEPHEARVCLLRSEKHRADPAVASLDMLMSVRRDGFKGSWQESHVRIVAEE
jgi:hypothetical protein